MGVWSWGGSFFGIEGQQGSRGLRLCPVDGTICRYRTGEPLLVRPQDHRNRPLQYPAPTVRLRASPLPAGRTVVIVAAWTAVTTGAGPHSGELQSFLLYHLGRDLLIHAITFSRSPRLSRAAKPPLPLHSV